MIKAYNETWVDNIDNVELIKTWHKQQLLSDEQLEAAQKEFPVGFYKSNIFVKIGLFLFTNMVASASIGFLSLFLMPLIGDSQIGLGFISLVAGILFFFLLEYFIKKSNFYRSGVDNALLYIGIGSFFSTIAAFTDMDLPFWFYCSFCLLTFGIALIRYADPLAAICLFVTWVALWFDIMNKFPMGKLILPFVVMLISVVAYFSMRFWRKREVSSYYSSSQDIIETLALTTFYLGGNYYVVREGNALLNSLSESVQIDLAPLFYAFTALIPFLYIFLGLKKHDRKLLLVGILAFAFSIFTYRAYWSVMPLEWALVLIGVLLTPLSIFAIKKLKEPLFRLTSQAFGRNKYQDLEAFIVNQAVNQPNQPSNKTQFGGGDFGGGGAGSSY